MKTMLTTLMAFRASSGFPGGLREHGASQRVGCGAFLHRYYPKHTASQATAGNNHRWASSASGQ